MLPFFGVDGELGAFLLFLSRLGVVHYRTCMCLHRLAGFLGRSGEFPPILLLDINPWFHVLTHCGTAILPSQLGMQ